MFLLSFIAVDFVYFLLLASRFPLLIDTTLYRLHSWDWIFPWLLFGWSTLHTIENNGRRNSFLSHCYVDSQIVAQLILYYHWWFCWSLQVRWLWCYGIPISIIILHRLLYFKTQVTRFIKSSHPFDCLSYVLYIVCLWYSVIVSLMQLLVARKLCTVESMGGLLLITREKYNTANKNLNKQPRNKDRFYGHEQQHFIWQHGKYRALVLKMWRYDKNKKVQC